MLDVLKPHQPNVHEMHAPWQTSMIAALPIPITLVNSMSLLLIALFMMSPQWLVQAGFNLLLSALESCTALAFISLFLAVRFLESGRFWLWRALRTLMITFITAGIIWLN